MELQTPRRHEWLPKQICKGFIRGSKSTGAWRIHGGLALEPPRSPGAAPGTGAAPGPLPDPITWFNRANDPREPDAANAHQRAAATSPVRGLLRAERLVAWGGRTALFTAAAAACRGPSRLALLGLVDPAGQALKPRRHRAEAVAELAHDAVQRLNLVVDEAQLFLNLLQARVHAAMVVLLQNSGRASSDCVACRGRRRRGQRRLG